MSLLRLYTGVPAAPFTGLASTSILQAPLPLWIANSVEDNSEFEMLVVMQLLQQTGTARDFDVDVLVNGTVIHRSSLYTNPHSAVGPRVIELDYLIMTNSATTCNVLCKAIAGSPIAAGQTPIADDIRASTPVTFDQPFNRAADITLDVQATLHGVSDATNYVMTPRICRIIQTQPTEVATTGSTIAIEDLPYGVMTYCEWNGSSYNTRPPVVGGGFQRVWYVGGPMQNGVNDRGESGSIDQWIDATGA